MRLKGWRIERFDQETAAVIYYGGPRCNEYLVSSWRSQETIAYPPHFVFFWFIPCAEHEYEFVYEKESNYLNFSRASRPAIRKSALHDMYIRERSAPLRWVHALSTMKLKRFCDSQHVCLKTLAERRSRFQAMCLLMRVTFACCFSDHCLVVIIVISHKYFPTNV